jgi:two-component system LytT family response regulator
MIRALLVDDERPARERLRRLLADHDDVEIVDEAADGEEALEKIADTGPDLVFLDIQMPGCSGMEVAASLGSPRPRIVFCTAYDEYAVDAFELRADDYLLKPVNRARLAKALERVRSGASGDDPTPPRGGHPTRFLAKRSSKYHVVPVDEVLCFLSEGGLTKLQTAERHFWMQPTLAELEQRLDPAAFFRISRSAIVRLDAVRAVEPHGGGVGGDVVLSDGERHEVARRRYRDLMEKLGG